MSLARVRPRILIYAKERREGHFILSDHRGTSLKEKWFCQFLRPSVHAILPLESSRLATLRRTIPYVE